MPSASGLPQPVSAAVSPSMMSDALLDDQGLGEALADAFADLRRDIRRELDTVALESRATIAELKGQVVELQAHLRERADADAGRVTKALAEVRNGRDGIDGKDGRDGTDGKSIDMLDVERMVAKAVEAIPKPRDGIDGKSVSVDDLLPLVEDVVEKRAAELPVPKGGRDGRDGIDGKDGRDGIDGRDGKDADPELTRAMVVKEIAEQIAAIPRPQDGRDGRDGKDADWEAIERRIDLGLQERIAALPVPKDGVDGKDGRDGVDGRDGIDGKDGASADRAEIEKMVVDAVSTIPVPKDGRDGIDGRDGKGIEDAFIGRDGELVFVFDKGRVKNLGAGFAKDITADALREMVSDAAADLYKGIWEPGQYKKGSWATYGGSLFVAQCDTGARPTDSEDWKLALKRGRDGKDAIAPKQPRPPMALPPKEGE